MTWILYVCMVEIVERGRNKEPFGQFENITDEQK